MKKKLNEAGLEISIYLKPNDRADLVFRKNQLCYRIGIIGLKAFKAKLLAGLEDLGKALILELSGCRMRHWVLEMGLLANGDAILQIWELAENELKTKFAWTGAVKGIVVR